MFLLFTWIILFFFCTMKLRTIWSLFQMTCTPTVVICNSCHSGWLSSSIHKNWFFFFNFFFHTKPTRFLVYCWLHMLVAFCQWKKCHFGATIQFQAALQECDAVSSSKPGLIMFCIMCCDKFLHCSFWMRSKCFFYIFIE